MGFIFFMAQVSALPLSKVRDFCRNAAPLSFVGRLPVVAVAVIGVASLTYTGVERPMIRAGAKLARRMNGRAQGGSAEQAAIAL